MQTYLSLKDKQSHFNNASWKVIDTVKDLEAEIENFKALKSSNSHTLFRGICEAKYKLYTSLQRDCFNRNIDTVHTTPKDIVMRMLQEGRTNPNNLNILPSYLAKMGIPLNDWILLALLQHYGAPSPLLDFTKDFIPALYFMCLGVTAYPSNSDIDQYFSIVYFKAVDACVNVFENLPKTALNIYLSMNPRPITYKEKDNFILEELSFEKVMNGRFMELIPSYKGVTKVRHKNYNWILNLPIVNMNMTSQEGEFICNISPNQPIEDLMIDGGNHMLHCVNIHKKLYHYIIHNYLNGSIETMRNKLFPTEYQAASDIYSRSMSKLF